MLLCVYRYRRTEQGYEPGTLRELTQDCGLTRTGPDTVRVSLPGGSDAAEHIFAAVVSWYQANDLASDAHEAFNRELFAAYADIPLDGAAVDELSYMTSPFLTLHRAAIKNGTSIPTTATRWTRAIRRSTGEVSDWII